MADAGDSLKLDPLAHYAGRLITDMSADELRHVLAAKVMELQFCYLEMKVDQQRLVAARMRGKGLL
jgi:hypothetical protein